MRSRWNRPLPTFDDRNDDATIVSIEAAMSNYFKHNFDEKYYDLMLQLVKDLKLGPDLYDPEAIVADRTTLQDYLSSEEDKWSAEGVVVEGDQI